MSSCSQFALLLLSPYCWSPERLCEFWSNCWDLIKGERNKPIPKEIEHFREKLNLLAKECELWAPQKNWNDIIPKNELDLLLLGENGVEKWKMDSIVKLFQLIRNKLSHPLSAGHDPHINWFSSKEDTAADKYLFSQYWVSKFVLVTPFLWSQFKTMGSTLSKYYPTNLLHLGTDWKEMFFRPEKFASELYDACVEQLNNGFVEERFTVSFGQSAHTVELRTLPRNADFLNEVLHGNSFVKIIVSKSTVTSECNQSHKKMVYKVCKEISKEKCVAYIFLGNQCSEAFDRDLFYDIGESHKKIIIFTCEAKMQNVALRLKKISLKFENNPLSWGDLSISKQNSIINEGNFKFEIQSREFPINEILPGQEQELFSHLQGKELNTLLKNCKLPVLHKCNLPQVDKYYQLRSLYDPAIVHSNLFIGNKDKNDVFIIAHEEPTPILSDCGAIELPKSKLFPKLNFEKTTCKIYTVRDDILGFKNAIRKFESCENGMNVHFFYSSTNNTFKWVGTSCSFDVVENYIHNNNLKNAETISETAFAYIVDECFENHEINFIVNQSGMGKSQFLVSIANRLAIERGRIPLYIFMNDFLTVLGKIMGKRADITLDDIIAAFKSLLCSTNLDKELLGKLLKSHKGKTTPSSRRLIIMFDGVDEVVLELKELALRSLKILHEGLPTLTIIAAIRDHMTEDIRCAFGTLGYKLCPLSEPSSFIGSYWWESFKARACTSSTSQSAETNENVKRKLFALVPESTPPNVLFGEFLLNTTMGIFQNGLLQTFNSLKPEELFVNVYDGVKQNLDSTAPPNKIFINEDEILHNVNSKLPKNKIIIIYDDLNVSISPLLINLAKGIDVERENKVLLLNTKTHVFAEIIRAKTEICHGKITFNVIMDTIRQYYWHDSFPSMLLEDIEELIFDGISLCSETNYYLLKFVLHALNKIANSSQIRIWVSLKTGARKHLQISSLNPLELQVESISKIEEELYIKEFWCKILSRREDPLFSKILEDMTKECLANGLSGNYIHLARVPLRGRLIAEVFEESVFKLDLYLQGKNKYSICDLYKIILRRKYEIYFRKKYEIPHHVSIDGIPFNSFRKGMNGFLQFLSISLIFSDRIANQFKNELLVSGKIEKCEEFYKVAIEEGILQNQNPVRFTHISFAEYFVAKFLYKNLKRYISEENSFRFKLDCLETGTPHETIWSVVLKANVESLHSIFLVHLGVLNFLNTLLEGKVDMLTKEDNPDVRKKLMETFIPRIMNPNKLPNFSFQGSIVVPGNIALLRAVYYEGLLNIQKLLLHSKKHLLGIFAGGLANLDFEVTDHLVQKVGLGPEYFCEISSHNKHRYGLLHWFIIGICCADENQISRDLRKIKKKLLEFLIYKEVVPNGRIEDRNLNGLTQLFNIFTNSKEKKSEDITYKEVVRKDLIEEKNLEGQTPLLFLISCMNRYTVLDRVKLHDFFVTELAANVNAVNDHEDSALNL